MKPPSAESGRDAPWSADTLAEQVRLISGCSLALVALAEGPQEWTWGLAGADPSSCAGVASLALQTLIHRRPWLVPDTMLDPLVGFHATVIGAPWVRRLGGIPVQASDGRVLGCLCIIDFEPQAFTPALVDELTALAASSAVMLERHGLEERLRRLEHGRPQTGEHARPDRSEPGPSQLRREVCLEGLKALFRLGTCEGIALLRLECLAVDGYVAAVGLEGLAVLMDRVAEGIRAVLPAEASFCRFAEEEFLLLVPQMRDHISLSILAGRLLAEIAASPYRIGDNTMAVTVAVGASLLDGSQPSLASALSEVGVASRLAASQPGGGFRLVDAGLRRKVLDDFHRQKRFREGLFRGALLPHFQPIVDLISGRTRGFEALARWRDPEGELHGPSDYLEVARHLGLNGELDLLVIGQVLDSLPALAAAAGGGASAPQSSDLDGLLISVNLSAQLLEREDHFESLLSLLASCPMPVGWRLQVEILEESMQLSDHRLDDLLSRLVALGVGVAIDDFGTGYSSLARLHTLPIQAFKIDRSFVERINDQTSPSNQLLRTINTLAIDLGLAVTAEGVDSAEQSDWLLHAGFLSAQGFHFSPPLSLEQALEHLRRQGGSAGEDAPEAPAPSAAERRRPFWRRLGRRSSLA